MLILHSGNNLLHLTKLLNENFLNNNRYELIINLFFMDLLILELIQTK